MPMFSFSPSVNIIRDKDREINYIRTINGQLTFEQIVETANSGARAFTIIGAYGSGKSTFLWALERAVNKENKFFEHFDYFLKGYPTYYTLDIVGEFDSLEKVMARELNCAAEDVINTFEARAKDLKEAGIAWLIRIDEFGKFLEYAAKSNNPEADFYFIQRLSEFINDPKGNVILITTLHQDFSAYAFHLSDSQRNEWLKVKGRFKEIAFNVPAEQLLLIAAERLNALELQNDIPSLKKVFKLIERSKAFPLNDYLSEDIAGKLSPLEILSGSVLTLALQRYGQNERSLFTFLDTDDYKGIHQFKQEEHALYYNLVHAFDYLLYHYYLVITAPLNQNFRSWQLILDCIEKAEGFFEGEELHHALAVIKTVGLLNLFARKSMIIDDQFLIDYLRLTMNYDVTDVVRRMQNFNILRFRKHEKRFVLFEGTDVDIDGAIELAKTEISKSTSISQRLNKLFNFPAILAKQHYLDTGNPRYFEFILSDEPVSLIPKGEVDGYINLVFSTTCTEDTIRLVSADQNEAILYIYYQNTQEIVDLLDYTEQVEIARRKNEGDRIALKEFDGILRHQADLLKKTVMDNLRQLDHKYIALYYNGIKVDKQISNWREFNSYLSWISKDVYTQAPSYSNEMVNKTKLSPQISSARRSLLNKLINEKNIKDLGYKSSLFPPDKTIYLSLLKQNGFHREFANEWQLTNPIEESFQHVWRAFEGFLESSKTGKRSLQDFVNQLSKKPFKLKKGLIDFVLPIFLLIKKDIFSLYYLNDTYISQLTLETLDLVVKRTENYSIKAYDLSGWKLAIFNRYRDLTNQHEIGSLTNQSFVDTIIPFLTFYKDLPEYAKRTRKIPQDAQRLRQVIFNATDPETAFFEEFPKALGYSLNDLNQGVDSKISTYFERLREAIKEIQNSQNSLLKRYEEYVLHELLIDDANFTEWRSIIQAKFQKINHNIIPSYLKTFLLRLNSNMDDKYAWLKSVAQSILGKSFEQITDHEEEVLYSRFSQWHKELLNFVKLEDFKKSENIQDAFRLELTGMDSDYISEVIEIPFGVETKVKKIEKQLQELLTGDKKMDIFILARILKDQINENR